MTVNTLGIHEQDRSSRTAAEWLWPLLPSLVSVFCLSALVYYHVRQKTIEVHSALQVMIASIYHTVGLAPAVLCFLLVLTWSSIWFFTGKLERPVGRVLRLLAMTVMLGVFLNLGDGGVTAAAHKGELGAWLAGRLLMAFGYVPSLILVWIVTFASLLLATDFFFSDSFERLRTQVPPGELGVEVAVTDHLRGLGSAVVGSSVSPRPAMPITSVERTAPPLVVAPDPVPAPAAPASQSAPSAEAAAEASAVEAEPSEASEPESFGRRRSYFERRREREEAAQPAGPNVPDEDWVPTAPDSQEIDNPESRSPVGSVEPSAEEAPAEELAEAADSAAASWSPRQEFATEDAFRAVPETAAADAGESADSEADGVGEAERAGLFGDDEDLDVDEVGEADEADEADADGADADEDADEDEADERASKSGEVRDADADDDDDGIEADDISEGIAEIPRSEAHESRSAMRGASRAATPAELPDEDLAIWGAAEEVARAAEAAAPPDEPLVSIPRPPHRPEAVPERRVEEPAVRQRGLFQSGLEEGLVQEAVEVVSGSRRATAAMLQRKLRIDYAQAMEVMAELGARGIVALEGDASTGRVLS